MATKEEKPVFLESLKVALQLPTIVTIFVAVFGGAFWVSGIWYRVEQQRTDLDNLQRRVLLIDALADRQRDMCRATQVLLRYQVPAEARPDLICTPLSRMRTMAREGADISD